MLTRTIRLASIFVLVCATPAFGGDRNAIGAGNSRAIEIARKSPLIKSAMTFLRREATQIQSPKLKRETLDAFFNP